MAQNGYQRKDPVQSVETLTALDPTLGVSVPDIQKSVVIAAIDSCAPCAEPLLNQLCSSSRSSEAYEFMVVVQTPMPSEVLAAYRRKFPEVRITFEFDKLTKSLNLSFLPRLYVLKNGRLVFIQHPMQSTEESLRRVREVLK